MSYLTIIERKGTARPTKLDHQNAKQKPVPEATKELTQNRGGHPSPQMIRWEYV
jgi:hypothetical protein